MTTTSPVRARDHALLHRRVTAVSLVGSALLVGVASVIAPANSGEADELYRIGTESAGRMTAEAYLMAASSVLLVFGVIGAARVVTGRGRVAARVAAVLGVMGALGHMAYSTFSLVAMALVASEVDEASVVTGLEEVNASAGVGILVFPLILAYALSMLILPIALYRARLVALWVVGVAAAGVLVEVVGGVGMVGNVKYVLGVVVTAAIAVRILRLTDDQWRDPRLLVVAADPS